MDSPSKKFGKLKDGHYLIWHYRQMMMPVGSVSKHHFLTNWGHVCFFYCALLFSDKLFSLAFFALNLHHPLSFPFSPFQSDCSLFLLSPSSVCSRRLTFKAIKTSLLSRNRVTYWLTRFLIRKSHDEICQINLLAQLLSRRGQNVFNVFWSKR